MTEKEKKRKYLLFKKDDGRPDHLKPCAFFSSPEGCKNGSNCRFMHGNVPGPDRTGGAATTTSSSVPPTSSTTMKGGIASNSMSASTSSHNLQGQSQLQKRSLSQNNNTNDDNELSDTNSEMTDEQMSIIEELPPTMSAIRKDHKKRRTNDPADEASYPSILRAESAAAEEEILKLKEHMANQQKMFEEQLKFLSSKIEIQSIKSKSNESISLESYKNQLQANQNNKTPGSHHHQHHNQQQSQSQRQLTAMREPFITPGAGGPTKLKKTPLSGAEDSDDEKFLFNTVNHILENGLNAPSTDFVIGSAPPTSSKKKSPKRTANPPNQQQQQQQQQQQFKPPLNPPGLTPNYAIANFVPNASSTASNNNNSTGSNPFSINPTFSLPSFQPINNNNSRVLNSNAAFGQQQQPPALNPSFPTSHSFLPTTHGMMGVAERSSFQLDTNNLGNAPDAIKSPGESSKNRKNIFAKPKHQVGPNGLMPKLDFKSIDYKHLNWEELVQKTQTHSRYKIDYNLNADRTWISARSSLKSEYPVIALDCEMCETEDPVTQARDSTLIRLSVVNGFNPEEVLIDTLVMPQLPVTDLRTRIHGITEEQLATATCTLRHVQAALLKIITEQTIIIGHSVYNDLKVLRLNHSKCVDTAYLFPVENENEGSRPGLKLVAEQLLGLNVPEPHDSIMDSRIALYAAAFALEVGCLTIKRSAASFEQPSLLVHRIPEYVTDDHIKSMIINHTYILPTSMSSLVRGESNSATDPVGKVTIYFLTQQHADLAFETIQGAIKPDKKNRPQKKVYLQGGGHVYVRK